MVILASGIGGNRHNSEEKSLGPVAQLTMNKAREQAVNVAVGKGNKCRLEG